MQRLRAPDGCPWDREQTFDTIRRYTLEETYEVIDAIDNRDWEGLKEELGDLLLQPVFHAQMASEKGLFDVAASLRAINDKLVRRHPHVFGDASAATADDVKQVWDAVKATEKQEGPKGRLDGIPKALPALLEAREISAKAAKAGFDWASVDQVFEKLEEEIGELKRTSTDREREDEVGDLFFVLVNIARHYKVDPELALHRANQKFKRRFAHVEQRVREEGGEFEATPIEQLDAYWNEAKRKQ